MKGRLLVICLLFMPGVTTTFAGDSVYTIENAYKAALKESEW